MVMIEGAPAGWQALNGVKAATYIDPNTVALDYGDSVFEWMPTHIDATRFGPWTGTASLKKAGTTITPVYNIVNTQVDGVHLINNHIENGDMTYFGAADGVATSYGVVQAGSTSSTIIIGNAVGPAKIGDFISVPAPGVSSYCGPPGGNPGNDACYVGGQRVGRITAISGMAPNYTFSVVPEGPDGIDVSPTVGKIGQWEGKNPTRIAWIRNKIFRDFNAFPVGKGAFELKACDTCLADGNISYGTPNGSDLFLEVKNQGTGGTPDGANIPWSVARHLHFTNNLIGSDKGGGVRYAINCSDYEHTNAFCDDVWFDNNVMPQATAFTTAPNFFEDQQARNSGYRHNTVTANPASLQDWEITPLFSCTPGGPPYLDDYSKHFGQYENNLISYGNGLASNPSCWPNQSTAVKGNLFITDRSISTSSTLSSWPGNWAISSLSSAGMTGACTFATWQNCGLGVGSPYRATASDGKDPGADILQVNDHQNGWSEQAGLIAYDNLNATYDPNPGAFIIGATHAAIKFNRFGSIAACSLQIFTDPARRFLHPDTSNHGLQTCARFGNVSNDGETVTFVLGNTAALTPATTYYYRITDSDRAMVGSFTTLGAEQAVPVSVQLSDTSAADARIEYAATPDLSGSSQTPPAAFVNQVTMPSVSLSGVQYYRWLKRDQAGTVLSRGPVSVAFRP